MELKDYKTGDEVQILELFELAFNRKMSLEHWNWRFAKNPAGNHLIKLMWDNDILVGHYAVSPLFVDVNGIKTLTAHSLTTMTHPSYGGKGIFKTLSLALYNDLDTIHGCKAVWGFPNNNSHYGFIKSLGWSDLAVIHTLAVKPDVLNPKATQEIKLKELLKFDESHSEYIKSKLSDFSVKVDRSTDYLNWRYFDKPGNQYKIFEIQEPTKTIIVSKIYPSSVSGEWDINLIELFTDDFNYLPSILKAIQESYNLPIQRITTWRNLFDNNHINLEKLGFYPNLPQTYIGARIHSDMPKSFNNFQNWSLSMGDSDVF